MDLAPFRDITPCGYAGLEVTQLADLGVREPVGTVADSLAVRLQTLLHPEA